MKKVFKIVCLLAVLMMVSGSAMAWDQAFHVKQAKNGKGDAIIFPIYFTAPGGWETKLTVINTSNQFSVISKISFRSHYYSQEVLDFLIYLTPADVWTGYVRHDGTNAYVYSEDDSVLVSATAFASKTTPMRQNLFSAACPSIVAGERTAMSNGDSSEFGYAEVIETWYGDVSANYPAPRVNTWSRIRPVAKDYLLQLYPPTGQPAWNVPGLTGNNVDSNAIDHTINVLTGYVELRNSISELGGTMMQGTILADLDPVQYWTGTAANGLEIATLNPNRNSLAEVEAALSKDAIALPYVNDPATGQMTVHMFNFPTKASVVPRDANQKDPITGECRYQNAHPNSPFWLDPAANIPNGVRAAAAYRCLAYGGTVYDLQENATGGGIFSGGVAVTNWCEELDMVLTSGYSSLFTEGWTSYTPNYTNRTGTLANPTRGVMARNRLAASLAFTGAPVIPFAVMFKSKNMDMVQGAYSDGQVFAIQNAATILDAAPNTATFNWLAEYQYWNSMPELGLNNVVLGYPVARTGACNALDANNNLNYWDNANNFPCIPVQAPRN